MTTYTKNGNKYTNQCRQAIGHGVVVVGVSDAVVITVETPPQGLDPQGVIGQHESNETH